MNPRQLEALRAISHAPRMNTQVHLAASGNAAAPESRPSATCSGECGCSEKAPNLACQEVTDDQKSAAYYKAGMLKLAPPWVPSRVHVLREQFGDFPSCGAGVAAGEHDCRCNKWGAVSVIARDGRPLGLRLDEFEPVAWRAQECINAKGREGQLE
jgi:hypothetical protein